MANPPAKAVKAASPARSPQLKENAKIENMYLLQSSELKSRLKNANIPFKEAALKHELQALWAMENLGLIEASDKPNSAFVDKVVNWCKMLVRDQLAELEERDLDVMGTKWDHIEVFIRAELDNGTSAFANLRLGNEAVLEALADPDPVVVNLLLSSIYLDTYHSKKTALLPGCPIAAARTVLRLIDELPQIHIADTLKKSLELTTSKSAKLLSWICSTYGGDIVPATGDLHIPGLPKTLQQFALVKPTPVLQTRFDIERRKHSTSCVLYHGTSLMFLRSIICNGFNPCLYDQRFGLGLFMAENPSSSYGYAQRGFGNKNQWQGTTFKNFGVLLGCEVAGKGRPTEGDHHVILELDSVIIRYIFMVDSKVSQDYRMGLASTTPAGSDISKAVLAGFAAIQSRQTAQK